MSQSREELLTVEEVADWLKLNPQTVRNMIDRSELSAIHVGSRRVRIRESELYLFLGIEPRVGDAFTGDVADILSAQDTTELVAALRTLAAGADRLANALDDVDAGAEEG